MKKVLLLLALGVFDTQLFATQLFATQLFAQEVLKNELSVSVNKAVKILEKDIKSKGLTIFAVINHREAAKEVGLKMNSSVVIIFGNPKVGTKLMNSNIAWSYELPLKIAIYKDDKGKVWAQTRLLPTDIKTPNGEKVINNVNGLLKKLIQIKK